MTRFGCYWKDITQNSIAGSIWTGRPLRKFIYRLWGHSINRKCSIMPNCYLGIGKGHLNIQGGVFINYNCWLDLGDDIDIGENCNIAMNVTILNSSHEIGTSVKRAGKHSAKPVRIGNGCWIGANSIIMPGVEIGNGVIIAAGSVVTKNCESNSIYAGVPAQKLRDLYD